MLTHRSPLPLALSRALCLPAPFAGGSFGPGLQGDLSRVDLRVCAPRLNVGDISYAVKRRTYHLQPSDST